MSQTQDQMRPQKVVSCAPAHITETEFAHDQHWEHSALSRIIFTIAVSSLARAQKMDTQSVALAHHTTGVSTCPTLRGAKHFPNTYYFFICLVGTQCPHIFTIQKQYWWDTNTETICRQLLYLVSTIQERWI